jgi:predicted nucleotidyltransferase component of viral defense system
MEYAYKLMFEDRAISIMAYNLETVLAEKLEAIITRGVTNTRMRDYYDVYILTNTYTFDTNTFKSTLAKTAEKRHTTLQMSVAIEDTIAIIMENAKLVDLWEKY